MERERIENAEGHGIQVVPDVFCLKVMIVNVCLVGHPGAGPGEWTLIDTGMTNSAEKILETAKERFAPESRPGAIILTHGHFDHVGAIQELIRRWDVPVYAHEEELPYLTGKADYPPPDPSVGGGLMARISPVYPHRGIDLGSRVSTLPRDGSVPAMSGWRWIHTPGHTKGHVSLFRESDRVLIAGDAITTVKQESAMAVLAQEQEIHGPPAYFTPDWKSAWDTVRRIQALQPAMVVSSHGVPMAGKRLSDELEALARDFDRLAIPRHGKCVH